MGPRGRVCPLAYRYQPEALAQPAQLEADTLYVVGGLYGNPAALAAVLERAHQEPGGPETIVFNGDFHWLDVDPDDFRAISEMVLAHHATKGNVEAELAAEDETAGCGCAYPDYVGDDVVDRSNEIITRLRATAGQFPDVVGRLGELPRHLTASVAGERVGIIHGDPESLAGWRLALEAMEPGDPDVRRRVGWRGRPTTSADLLDWFGRAKVSVFASTHTGLPFAQVIADSGQGRLVINNGSAGLPGFADTTYGVITRLSGSPALPPTACTAPPSAPCAATRCRCGSISPGGWRASWPSGRQAALAIAPTSAASPAVPTCGWSRPHAAASTWARRLTMLNRRGEIIKTLRATPVVLRALVEGVDDDRLRRRPAPREWAIIEVVGHLADTEERALARVRRMLAEEDPELEPFDQEALAEQRHYLGLELAGELARLVRLRAEHLALLVGLDGPSWERTGRHGEHGEMSLELYETHVAAEEVDHLAQIARLL